MSSVGGDGGYHPTPPPFPFSFHLLELTVASAQDLFTNSRSMLTYAVAWIDPTHKLRTRLDHAGCIEPTWNDKFVFRVDDTVLRTGTAAVTINIYAARSRFLSMFDTLVGTARALLSALRPSTVNWFVAIQDALLASIAETEKQTELATRVSTWKQRIEHTLEEQDAHPPPFDIHLYGERILDKLFLEVDSGGTMPFTDVVMGQPKHDVARTFSALLQLVNNGNVDLQRAPASNELVCHTAANPFYVRLLRDDRRREELENRSVRKRVKSPLRKGCIKANSFTSEATSALKSLHQDGRFSLKLGKGSAIRFTPEGKRRRRSSRLAVPSGSAG